jgi:hypothetical protein
LIFKVLRKITKVTAILTYLVREIGSNLVIQDGILWFLGGWLAYLHCNLASRRRRRKGNPVSGSITGPPCHWGTQIQGPVPPGWVLNARLTNLPCKNIMFQNPKK